MKELMICRKLSDCDGDYWHGNNWRIRGMNSIEEELSRYTPYWANKIKRNIERDQRVNEELENEGWVVLRFWESSIRKNSQECAMEVYRVFQKRSKQCKCMSNKS
jgi:DNA mismatch endonuclease (patch repair protein)